MLAWALVLARRSEPTLWKGSSLVIVNALFLLAMIIDGVWRASETGAVVISAWVIIFDITLVVIALWVRDKWLLIGVTHAQASEILEHSFTRTRAAVTRREFDYVVKCGGFDMIAGITPNRVMLGNLNLPLPGHTIRFSGAHASKKAKLIRSLFSKQFGGSFPTPRIRA